MKPIISFCFFTMMSTALWAAKPIFLEQSPKYSSKSTLGVLNAATQETHFAIQMGAFDHIDQAQKEVDLYQQQGIDAYLVTGKVYSRVLIGQFETYVDAVLILEDIKSKTQKTGCFIKRLPGSVSESKSGLKMVPDNPYPALAKEVIPTREDFRLRKDYQDLEALDKPETRSLYQTALETALSKLSSNDPLYGYCHLNLAILDMRAGELKEALVHLEAVLAADTNALAGHRVMALRRIGFVLHSQGDRLGAYRAYNQLEQEATTPNLLATAITEKLGLLMELAECGKGSHEEVRQAYLKSAVNIPEKCLREVAVVDLIYMETYARQPRPQYDVAAQLGEQFLNHYSAMEKDTPMRELAAAMYQTALFHRKAGNTEKAIELYNRVFDEIPEDVEQFAGFNPHAQSLIGFAHLAKMRGDQELSQKLREDVLGLFPEDEISRKILRNSPELPEKINREIERPETLGEDTQ